MAIEKFIWCNDKETANILKQHYRLISSNNNCYVFENVLIDKTCVNFYLDKINKSNYILSNKMFI